MSIFDKFKKIFSGFDSFSEPPKGGVADIAEQTQGINDPISNVEKQERVVLDKGFQNEFLKVLMKKNVQDNLIKFSELVNNKASATDILTQLNRVTNLIVNQVNEDLIETYFSNDDLFKAYVTEVISKNFLNYNKVLLRSDNKEKAQKEEMRKFVNYINPQLTDLYNLCESLTLIYNLYLKSPGELFSKFKERQLDLKELLQDTFYIVLYYKRLQQQTYFEVTEEDKNKFLEKVNNFVTVYSNNDMLQHLHVLAKEQQQYDREVDPHAQRGDIIGFRGY